MELADRVYVFCKDSNKGIMFYDQSPKGVIAELTGYLSPGKYWSSGYEIVDWNDAINGKATEMDFYDVTDDVSVIKQSIMSLAKDRNRDDEAFSETTIIVSTKNFVNILNQLHTKRKVPDTSYFLIDLNSTPIMYNKYDTDDSIFASNILR